MSDRYRPRFSHLGCYAFDPEAQAEFYCREFGLIVTDRGTGTTGHHVVFMSGDPHDHHQLVFANGREPGSKPLMNQISFRVKDVTALKAYAAHFAEIGIPLVQCKTHGNALSIYIHDPEGNTVEVYCHTPWYVGQPTGVPMDLSKSDEEILAQSEALCRAHPSFQMREDWSRGIQGRLHDRIGSGNASSV